MYTWIGKQHQTATRLHAFTWSYTDLGTGRMHLSSCKTELADFLIRAGLSAKDEVSPPSPALLADILTQDYLKHHRQAAELSIVLQINSIAQSCAARRNTPHHSHASSQLVQSLHTTPMLMCTLLTCQGIVTLGAKRYSTDRSHLLYSNSQCRTVHASTSWFPSYSSSQEADFLPQQNIRPIKASTKIINASPAPLLDRANTLQH